MRRFSQRNSLVTLSDINITPLLEKGLPLSLPTGVGQPDVKPHKEDIRTLDVTARGAYYLQGRQLTPGQITKQLVADFAANPNLVVFIRADNAGRIQLLANALDICVKAGINAVSIRGEAGGALPP